MQAENSETRKGVRTAFLTVASRQLWHQTEWAQQVLGYNAPPAGPVIRGGPGGSWGRAGAALPRVTLAPGTAIIMIWYHCCTTLGI